MMNQSQPHQNSEFFENGGEGKNHLWHYVQSLNPEVVEQLSHPHSQEVFQVMERNIVGLLGGLPSDQFNVSISTSREHLGRLLASAMMSGYFLRNAEQRMNFEKSLQAAEHSSSQSDSNESQ
ncbi:DUF760 domain-containing protein [Dactylococcopsis salina]|uniref:DUF760 domain-containing protein n=1 Tax=Dactylococcopsis salina (strain PCC 8305) TaxID=13035 RepID=K9YV42_DACS8|nr:Protein of unknown function (DUF760) [Dactylococcopsis salina PCC 8305]